MTEINWFQSNKYYPSRKLGIYACISSRITTVIQVVRDYQINYNWYNEPFAVSQYKAFILRHAWLNLWDERMTTGRINQVAILKGFLQRSQWSDQKRKYMSFILLNFTYSITRIYCITNAAQSYIKYIWHTIDSKRATKHNSAFKSLFLHTPGEASTN